jgi:hypothetical protein
MVRYGDMNQTQPNELEDHGKISNLG